MADLLHEEISSSLNFRVQSCPRVGGQCPPLSKVGGGGGGGGAVAPPAPLLLHHCLEHNGTLLEVRGILT